MSENLRNSIQNNLFSLTLGGGLAVAGIIFVGEKIHDFQERRKLTKKRIERQRKRNEQFDQLEKSFPKVTNEALAILHLPFEKLRQKLQNRQLTATQVLEAFIAKSIATTREFNCVTEFIPQMWQWADELDGMVEVKGPLHGIPICIKDDHDVQGMDSTLGLSVNLDKPAKENATVVQQLIDAGALPFCKTNIPQTLSSAASDNPIYGTTYNPLNKNLSPGGSSSGTACLVRAGGASFGTGSDSGGSLRIPAHFCGLCTLKPSIGRISGKGVVQCFQSSAGYVGVSGILAQRASTLALVFQTVTKDSLQNKYDPLAVPIPWNDEIFFSKTNLRIGYCSSCPMFPALGDTPGIIMETKDALEKLGHLLLPFEMPDNLTIVEAHKSLARADGGNQNFKKLKHDQVSHVAQKFVRGKTILSWIWERSIKIFKTRSWRIVDGNPEAQKSEILWDYLETQKRIKYDILDRMQSNQLDLLLIPAYPFPACGIQDSFAGTDIYTSTWNLVNFVAGIVPMGKETCLNVDGYDDEGDHYLKMAKHGIKSSKGMPIGVQIIGKPFNEEMVLRVLVELDEYKLQHD